MNSFVPPRAAAGDLGPPDHPSSRHSRRPSVADPVRRGGLTLIEMLVAMAITLILMFAVVQIFAILGESVSAGRATIEMSGQLRSTALRLEEDLDGLTAPVRPWIKPDSGLGYFEYIEGPDRDFQRPHGDLGTGPLLPAAGDVGDADDVLMFTVRSMGEPFTGRVQKKFLYPGLLGSAEGEKAEIIESPVAEIIWWTSQTPLDDRNGNYRFSIIPSNSFKRDFVDVNGNDVRDPDGLPVPTVADGQPHPDDLPEPMETVTLYRRVLLVRPDIIPPLSPQQPQQAMTQGVAYGEFFNHNDISARLVNRADLQTDMVFNNGRMDRTIANGLQANSLSDLTKRENRFAHGWGGLPLGYPSPLDRAILNSAVQHVDLNSFEDHTGEDVILSHVMAFDVRVYDPGAIPISDGNVILVPGDPGYARPFPPNLPVSGAYVDLNYAGLWTDDLLVPNSILSGRPHIKSRLFGNLNSPYTAPYDTSYDTWSFHYENDGLDQDGDGLFDEGTNGVGDPGLDDQRAPTDRDAFGVDDVFERETSPPYPVPLRGLEVRIRMIEQDAQAIRQVRVVADFVPE